LHPLVLPPPVLCPTPLLLLLLEVLLMVLLLTVLLLLLLLLLVRPILQRQVLPMVHPLPQPHPLLRPSAARDVLPTQTLCCHHNCYIPNSRRTTRQSTSVSLQPYAASLPPGTQTIS
jgi:hypothetical protein